MLKTIRDWLVYIVVRVVVCMLQAISIEACLQLAKFLAWLAYDLLRIRRDIVDDNLAHALPELSLQERQRIGRGMWTHLVTLCCELAHSMRELHETNWRKMVHITNRKEIVSTLLDPRPTCLVTGHFGNFELGGYATGILGFVTHTVARTLDNRFLDSFMLGFREAKLQYILPKIGSAPQADAVLQTGGTLVLLGDQNAGTRGCKVQFLNRSTHCHKALALFTLVSGAPMMVSYCRRLNKPMRFEIGLAGIADPANPTTELADAKSLSQWYMDCLAKVIRQSPDQYWWVHRLWRDAKEMKAKEQANAQVRQSKTVSDVTSRAA